MYELESNAQTEKDLAKDTFLEKWPDWLRWVLLLPASIIIPILIILLQNIFTAWFLDIGSNAFYLVIVRGIVYGAGIVYVASFMAPKKHKVVSIFMLILLSLIVAMSFFGNLAYYELTFNAIAELVIILISGGYMAYNINQDSL